MAETDNYEMDSARACIYGFFSKMLSNSPTERSLKRLFTPKTAAHVKKMLPEDENWLLYEQLTSFYNDGELTTDDIQLDFESLMRVPGPSYIYPYESSYAGTFESRDDKRWGDLSSEINKELENYYKLESLDLDSKIVDFPDHMAAELKYMGNLSKKIVDTLKSDDNVAVQLNREKQIEFAEKHLLKWVFSFSDNIARNALTPFYRWISGILTLFMKKEEEYFNRQAK